jgi:DNA-binding Lrp family transcriptional regulator
MKEDILKYLGTATEATAKTIADRLGLPSLEVLRELNAMIKDGAVEREMRKGEYAYWLTRAEAKPATPTEPASAPSAPVATPEVFDPPEFREVDGSVHLLCELLDVDLDKTDTPIKEAIEAVRLNIRMAVQTVIERDMARAEIESQKEVIAKLKENTAALERSIDDLTGVADVQLPKVYVTVGKTAPAKRHGDLLKAQRRAAVLVRTEKESEVLVLAPVGRMVRGSEWREQ